MWRLGLLLVLAGCGRDGATRAPATAPPRTVPAAADERPLVLCLGTSLTAGLGLDPEHAYPALLQKRIDGEGLRYRVVNAGVSGETSAGALRRIDWVLRQPVSILIVETGANDGLRGQDPDALRANLDKVLRRVREGSPSTRILLLGMEAPANFGAEYTRRFRAVFPELARVHGVAFVPFFLDGVAGLSDMNQPDGIHPTAEGQRRAAENLWKVLRRWL